VKKLFGVLALLAALVAGAPTVTKAQNNPPQGEQLLAHKIAGVFYAPAYATWRSVVISGNSSTGAGQSIILRPAFPLRDGYNVPAASLFNTNVPISVGVGAVNETVTPTAVSLGTCPLGTPGVAASDLCATITGTFNNLHGNSEQAVTGDAGIFEAITDSAVQGGGLVFWQVDTGNVTLNTGGLTTTTSTKVPTQFVSFGASARVETTITVTASWAVGISGSTSAFCTANATLTAGTTCIANMNSPALVGSTSALTAVLITGATSNPGAGVVKARVWGYTPVQSSF
jgi:hypothetical protein